MLSREIHEYSRSELDKIYAAQDREIVGGSVPRYWGDVTLGEELIPLVRRLHNLAETLAWLIGCGNPMCKSFIITGDATWNKGEVACKYVDNGKYCVDVEYWGENQ